MRGFFKTFFAALLALVIFFVALLIVLLAMLSPGKPEVGKKAILVVDLSQNFHEQTLANPLSGIASDDEYDVPGVYDVVRLIKYASTDTAVHGIYLKCNNDPNGFSTNEEIRQALAEFTAAARPVGRVAAYFRHLQQRCLLQQRPLQIVQVYAILQPIFGRGQIRHDQLPVSASRGNDAGV